MRSSRCSCGGSTAACAGTSTSERGTTTPRMRRRTRISASSRRTRRSATMSSTWIGSADLMPRNLDRRIEVLVPVEDARLRAELDKLLDALQADTRFSWELAADGTWSRTGPARNEPAVSAQELLMGRAAKRAK